MTDRTEAYDNELAAFMQRLTDELQRQCEKARGWPARLRLPTPQTEAEKDGFNLWIGEVQKATGAAIRIDFVDRKK